MDLNIIAEMLKDHIESTDQIRRDCQESRVALARMDERTEGLQTEVYRQGAVLDKLQTEVTAIDKRATTAGAVSGVLSGLGSFLAAFLGTKGA